MDRYTIHTYTFIWLFFYIYTHWFIIYSSVFFHSFIALNIHINGAHYNCLLLKLLLLFCCLWRFYISENFLISTFNYKFDDPECLRIYSTTPMETARSLDLLCAMGLWISVFCICYWMNDYTVLRTMILKIFGTILWFDSPRFTASLWQQRKMRLYGMSVRGVIGIRLHQVSSQHCLHIGIT